jgi:signal transduction histidine kinase
MEALEVVASDGIPADRLAALAEFAAGAGHEINNPVATIVGYVQQLLRDERDPERRQALLTIGAQAYRIRDMIGDVMLFARPPAPQPVAFDLAKALQDVAAELQEQAHEAHARIQVDAGATVRVFADPIQVRVIVHSLLQNAIDAMTPSGGGVVVSVCEQTGPEGLRAILAVRDNGRGFTDADREHLFDPFYSGRQAGRGLGFGLPKVWRIVTQNGGAITVESPDGGGTIVTVTLPVAESCAQPDAAFSAAPSTVAESAIPEVDTAAKHSLAAEGAPEQSQAASWPVRAP